MTTTFSAPVPILRSFDEAKARAFWIDFLGFTVQFEHRFEPGLPLYMGIVRDACVIHISEHSGDGCPGANLRIEVADVDALQQDLLAREYRHSRPGPPQLMPWGTKDLTIADPFGNRVTFFTRPT